MKSCLCRLFKDVWDGSLQWSEILLIIAIPIFFYNSYIVDCVQVSEKIKISGIEPLIYYAVRMGDFVVGILVSWMLARFFYRIHEKKLLNVGMNYHNHSMLYYRLCAKLLGYKRCSLLRVPIPMQFRLVLNDVFDEYYIGDDSAYSPNGNENIRKEPLNCAHCNEINICVEDTYPIKDEYIPEKIRNNAMIKISRYEENKKGIRCYSKPLIEAVASTVNRLPNNNCTVHFLATTNVRNTVRIAQDVFKTGGRGNIKHLYVYEQPQGDENIWKFSSSPTKVF